MVIASVVVTGLIGGAIGAPTGVILQKMILGEMGRVTGFNLPASVIDIYHPAELVLFALGGLLIAVLGALLPAGWAARTRTATALTPHSAPSRKDSQRHSGVADQGSARVGP